MNKPKPPFRAPPNLDALTREQLIETIHTLVASLNHLQALIVASAAAVASLHKSKGDE